jgi:amino acid transporter
MGTFQSSTNIGDLLGAGIFAIVGVWLGASWPIIVFITCLTMALAAILFATCGEERPRGHFKSIID